MEMAIKFSLLIMALIPLIGMPNACAAPIGVTHTRPDGRPVIHRIGRFGVAVHRLDRPVTSTEIRTGTPAQAVNILNSTLTNRIDNNSVVENAFLNGISGRLRMERPLPSFSNRQNLGKNVLLTGKDGNLRNEDNFSGNQLSDSGSQGGDNASSSGRSSTNAAGDGSAGSMGYTGQLPAELSQGKTRMEGDKLIMGQGSALVSSQNRVLIQTGEGEIRLEPLASAFIVQFGNDVSVYNLGDSHTGDISVVLNNKSVLEVPLGHQMVLSREQSEFSKANPSEKIKCNSVHHLGKHHDVHVFDAVYSPISLLDNAPQLEKLVDSDRPEDTQTVKRMFKSVAALLATSGN